MPPTYVIAELRADQKGGYCPRGAAKELWRSKGVFEQIIAGPAETGKTWACLQLVDAMLWKYAGAQGVIARKTYNSLVGSAIRTYQRIIGPESPIKPYGNNRPEWYDYPNGSRLWVAGLDNADKLLSSERDFIYVNQAEELTLDDWEKLATRVTGRGAVMPYTRLFGDCNPGPPTHWIKHRSTLSLLESKHEDNPVLYDDAGQITEQGKRTMAVLDALTGMRKERLRHGRWVQSEGVIYEQFDARVHVINAFRVPPDWPRLLSVDFGFTNPFVCQFWAIDGDGRLYRYREIYRTQRLVEDHARRILELLAKDGNPPLAGIICDHDAEGRATLERYLGIATTPAIKDVQAGIQSVMARLRVQADGLPRLFLVRDALDEHDQELIDKKKPCCTEEEVGNYRWKDHAAREEPVKEDDHGCDGTRMVVHTLDCGNAEETETTWGR